MFLGAKIQSFLWRTKRNDCKFCGLRKLCYFCDGIETINSYQSMIACLIWVLLYAFIIWMLAAITSWWAVIIMHIGAVIFLLIYKGDAIFRGSNSPENPDDKTCDDESYRAAREERDAYDDYWASIDMDND